MDYHRQGKLVGTMRKNKNIVRRLWLDLVCLLLLQIIIAVTSAFSPSTNDSRRTGRIQQEQISRTTSRLHTRLHLIPLRNYRQDILFTQISNSKKNDKSLCLDTDGKFRPDPSFQLCIVEEDDLPDTARFIVQSFGSEAIRMSSDMNGSFEQFILRPTVELLNGYSGIVAFAEVLAGLRSRIRQRLVDQQMGIQAPVLEGLSHEDQIAKASSTALVLVLAKTTNQDETNDATNNNNWRIEIIGSVELRLQPCDAKIPFTLPWLDRIERRLASAFGPTKKKKESQQQQPYLSNLCVAEEYRGQQIGRVLVQCVEEIACQVWGYPRIYLHVDVDNTAAYNLYTSAGYKDVGKRWNPFWAGSAADIGYFVKQLK